MDSPHDPMFRPEPKLTVLDDGLQAAHAWEGSVYISLQNGYEAVIDKRDWRLVKHLRWTAKVDTRKRSSYALATIRTPEGKRTTVTLHRFLWRAWGRQDVPVVDHQDEDGLNCRRRNLRGATHAQNMRNRSCRRTSSTGLKGVVPRGGKFSASIQVDGKRVHLGTHETAELAHQAYASAAKDLHKSFARVT